nr:SAF domain-containing protein [Oscillibacter sp.]
MCNGAFIPKGQPVGEHIGRAAVDIRLGSHVHVHNVQSNRELM